MAVSVSNEYKQVIYSGDARNKLKLFFNNVELQDADRYCEKLTVKSRIIPNGAKIFNLNNFISKEADLILHDIDTSIIQNQVSISIGTLVGNSYEYVPIGIFNIENQPTNDKNKTTIKLRDNSVKFDFNYNAQPLIEQNGGVATKLQILQDICSQAGVTCNITSFVGYLDEIGVYDNTITAREYISRLAEQAGRIATINRSGELIFVDLNNLTTWEIPIEIVEKYENGTKFKIGRIVYEDGIIRYETPTSNDDTLFLDGSNNYINGELVKEQASSNDNTYYLEDSAETELIDFELEGKTTQETRSGKNLFNKEVQTNNKLLTWNNGVLYDENGSIVSDYFEKGNITELYSNYYFVAFYYDANKTYLGNGGTLVKVATNPTEHTIIPNDSSIAYIKIEYRASFNNNIDMTTKTDIMLTKSESELTPYEQYGAMPSPDYPSELVSVGYENLLNFASIIPATASTTVTLLDTGINLKNTRNGYGAKINIANLKANTDYYISYKWENVSNGLNRVYVFAGSTQATTLAYLNNGTGFKFNTGNNTSINIWFYVQSNSTGEVNYKDIQLLEGTQTHSYIPYGKYGIEVKTQGENLKNKTTWTSGYLNNSNQVVSNNDWKYSDYIDISNGNYIYTSTGTGNLPKTVLYNENKEPIVYLDILARTIDLSLYNATYIRISVANGVFNGLVIKKINTYLYTLDNPLRSIGDTKDLLYIENGMLYVDWKIGSKILNGSESTWSAWGTGVGGYKLSNFINGNGESDTTLYPIASNYFKAKKQGDIYRGEVGIQVLGGNVNALYVRHNSITTLANWKTWLSTHNTKIQYILAKPYTEELGQVQLPNTYKSVTRININSNINTNSYIQYRQNKTQLEAILQNTNQFSMDSLKTGKILGNPAIDSYDLIQITDGNKIFKTLATNDLVYTGVLINTFDTQIGEEAKEQNVFINGEETFKKWARTTIDNVEGTLTLQAGQIDEANGKINETNLIIEKDGALLNVLANNSNIDVQYDSEGNPLSGEVREVTTTTGFKFNAEGMTIEDTSSNFKAQHRNTGTYYKDGDTIVGQYTKDGSKQKDLDLFGVYTYGKNDIDDTPMFIAQLYTDANGEECFGHFYNRGD